MTTEPATELIFLGTGTSSGVVNLLRKRHELWNEEGKYKRVLNSNIPCSISTFESTAIHTVLDKERTHMWGMSLDAQT
jgi:hypothetical protein